MPRIAESTDSGASGGDDSGSIVCGIRGKACCASATCDLRSTCDGTACIAADVWAAGADGASNFNGGTWTTAHIGTSRELPALNALWGTEGDSIFGVGDAGVIVRKDSAGWHVDRETMSSPDALLAVAGTSANDVWAVGAHTFSHYDGNVWVDIAAPPSDDVAWTGVWLSAPGEGWATGELGYLAHLTGGSWSGLGRIGNGYDRPGIWGFNADDIWRVGKHHQQVFFAAIQHYDGKEWADQTINTINDVGLPPLRAIWGSDDSHVWAVGDEGTIVFWNGVLWRPILSGTDDSLRAIWGSGPNDVWVAGGSGMRHFNGTAWAAVPGLPVPPAAVWLSKD